VPFRYQAGATELGRQFNIIKPFSKQRARLAEIKPRKAITQRSEIKGGSFFRQSSDDTIDGSIGEQTLPP
jgi:hypothetical protein